MALDSRRIQKNFRKLRNIFKNSAKLRSPQPVHDLRTRTRRVEALLRNAGIDRGRGAKHLLGDLRPIRKKAGDVRDMDVLTSHLLELNIDRAGEGDCEVQLLEHLGEERHRLGKKLQRAVRKNRAGVRKRLKHPSDHIQSMIAPHASNTHRKRRVEAAASVLELVSGLSEPKTLNRTNLHPYRRELKSFATC